jgi:hypothetical protein
VSDEDYQEKLCSQKKKLNLFTLQYFYRHHLNQKRLNFCESIDRKSLCIVVEKFLEIVIMVAEPIPESLLSDKWDFSWFRHNGW